MVHRDWYPLASGVAFSVTRAVCTIWVNQRTTSDIRATETVGEVVGGLALVLTAQAASTSAAFTVSGALIACVGALTATLGLKGLFEVSRDVVTS